MVSDVFLMNFGKIWGVLKMIFGHFFDDVGVFLKIFWDVFWMDVG